VCMRVGWGGGDVCGGKRVGGFRGKVVEGERDH
jgi:hypothetical protein